MILLFSGGLSNTKAESYYSPSNQKSRIRSRYNTNKNVVAKKSFKESYVVYFDRQTGAPKFFFRLVGWSLTTSLTLCSLVEIIFWCFFMFSGFLLLTLNGVQYYCLGIKTWSKIDTIPDRNLYLIHTKQRAGISSWLRRSFASLTAFQRLAQPPVAACLTLF